MNGPAFSTFESPIGCKNVIDRTVNINKPVPRNVANENLHMLVGKFELFTPEEIVKTLLQRMFLFFIDCQKDCFQYGRHTIETNRKIQHQPSLSFENRKKVVRLETHTHFKN
jgi:hypothetical protein